MPFYDFALIKDSLDIVRVAHNLGLQLKPSGAGFRSPCPVCKSDNKRGLVVTPGRGYFCFSNGKGGDVIGLVSHIMEVEAKDAAAWLTEQYLGEPTAPERQKAEPTASKFDPDAFLSKLTAPEDMPDALTFRAGMHRGNLYVPAVYPSGTIAGWWKLENGKLIAPKHWLPDSSNVVQLKRPA